MTTTTTMPMAARAVAVVTVVEPAAPATSALAMAIGAVTTVMTVAAAVVLAALAAAGLQALKMAIVEVTTATMTTSLCGLRWSAKRKPRRTLSGEPPGFASGTVVTFRAGWGTTRTARPSHQSGPARFCSKRCAPAAGTCCW
jgi:hypothetical protein